MNRSDPRDNPVRSISLYVVALSLLWTLGSVGCDGLSNDKKNGDTPASAPPGKLYIANAGDGSLLAFDKAISTEGNLAPARRFPETIAGPTGVFLDRTTDTLYVANTDYNSILIYENVSSLNLSAGQADATRVIAGPKTGLNHPYGVAYDATRQRLYVANKENLISVFQKDCPVQTNLNGDIAPCRTLSGASTLLDFPRAIAVDPQRDLLYISNLGTNSILVYANASQLSTQGDLQPTRVISSHTAAETESMLYNPFGLFLDSLNDRLYVLNSGRNQPAILIYEGASARSGAIVPDRVFTGQSTQLNNPVGIDLFVEQDRLYVLNNNNTNNGTAALIVFSGFNSKCPPGTHLCNFAPDRAVSGQQTGLANPVGIAYDPQRDISYIGNTQGNNILVFALEGNLAPIKFNSGNTAPDGLMHPDELFYDKALDRLYVLALNSSSSQNQNQPNIIVYEHASSKPFINKQYDWGIRGRTSPQDISYPRGFYIDKGRQALLILNSQDHRLLLYDLSAVAFPNPDQATPGQIVVLPAPLATFGAPSEIGAGFTFGRAIAVDESRAEIYIADDCTVLPTCDYNQQPYGNSIYVYQYDGDPAPGIQLGGIQTNRPVRVIGRGCKDRNNPTPASRACETIDNTQLNRPHGLFYDTRGDGDPQNDILYVTNTGASGPGANSILAFHNPGSLGSTLAACDAVVTANQSPSPCNVAPNRTISSSASFADAEKLTAPIAPFVNAVTDRLFLINFAKDSLFIFDNASARSGPTRPSRIVSGTNTLLAFSGALNTAGALLVDVSQGREIVYVAEPKDPTCPACNQTAAGAILVFGVEGNAAPSRVWSGGGAALIGPSAIAVDPTRDILYVANQGDPKKLEDDSISIFTKASRANGNLPMTGTVAVNTGSPSVSGTGTIFTAEFATGDAIKIGTATYTIASIASDTSMELTVPYTGTSGTELPASFRPRTLCSPVGATCQSPDTKLNNPAGLAVDPAQNRLYVSNNGTTCSTDSNVALKAPCNAILVFHAAGNLSNNAVPDQTITSSALNNPRGLALDPVRKTLYAANNGSHSILVFKNVESLHDTVTPDAEIGGVATQINAPAAVAYDAGRDLLYVLNQGGTPQVLVFTQASSLNGNAAPARVLSGSFMKNPSALFLDPVEDLLYVADQGANAVYTFTGASKAQGEANHRTLTGNNTGLNQPIALFVDTTR